MKVAGGRCSKQFKLRQTGTLKSRIEFSIQLNKTNLKKEQTVR